MWECALFWLHYSWTLAVISMSEATHIGILNKSSVDGRGGKYE